MGKRSLRVVIVALVITLVAGLFTGCGNSEEDSQGEGIRGSITAAGSSALHPLAQAAADMFMAKNTKAQINVQGGGSGTGLSQVSSGAVQIGNSDIPVEDKVKEADVAKALVGNKVCAIGFAMVVNKDVKVDSLTKQQIQDIFTGKITNWKNVGGEDLKIEVINRGKSSGTRAAFLKKVMEGKRENEGIGTVQDSSGAVQKSIEATKGAVSYLALSYFVKEEAKKGMKLLKIDGAEATTENIAAGKYPFWAYEYMYTKGEPTGLTKAFIDYIVSDEFKPVIEEQGYIPMSSLKAQKK